MFRKKALLLLSLVTCLTPYEVNARVVRFVVEQRTSVADGMSWGDAGPYERLDGIAYMEVDPKNPLDAVIVNLDEAPRNARGLVELTSPFRILKPADMARSNHKIWYAINNRGNCNELGRRSFPFPRPRCNPSTAAEIGDNNVLLQQGYTVVDAGWQGDGKPNPQQLFPTFPVATQADGSPIVGLLRLEFSTVDTYRVQGFTQPIPLRWDGARGWRTYEPADTNTNRSVLTVRDRVDAARTAIPADHWAFGRCPAGQASLEPTTADLCLFDGFAPDKIYELIYPARSPIVMGLGYAVTRDIGSFLRYELHDEVGNPNPLALSSKAVGIRRAYSSGTSSTGMYLREFLYLGFNEDEAHHRVFDAVTIYSGGANRLFANVQFAHPTFFALQDWHHDFTANAIAPFTFGVTTDPISGTRDGILKRPATDPLVFQIDEEFAFWQWRASLNVADGLGHPVAVPSNVRLYFLNGFSHIGAAGLLAPAQPAGFCAHPTFSIVPMPAIPRALTIAIDEWADKGIEPPRSNYPRLENKTLVSLAEYRQAFPAIPGLEPPPVMNELNMLNFGPLFNATGGVQTLVPPARGPSYQLFVPRPGADGASDAGIDTIWTRVPLGTNIGWNFRAGARAPDLCFLSGSFIPFAKTRAERIARGDSRLSLEERYKNHSGFVKAVEKATRELISERFLLPEDGATFIEAAQASDVLK